MSIFTTAFNTAVSLARRSPVDKPILSGPFAGHTKLTATVWQENMECVRTLVCECNADVDAFSGIVLPGYGLYSTRDRRATPLMFAADRDTPKAAEIAGFLLDWGACPNLQARSGYSAIFFASAMGHTKTLEKLLKWGVSANLESGNGQRPLYHPILSNNIEKIELLLQYGANPNLRVGTMTLLGIARTRRDALGEHLEPMVKMLEDAADRINKGRATFSSAPVFPLSPR